MSNLIDHEQLIPLAGRPLEVFTLRPDDDRPHPTALLIAGSRASANVWRSWGKQLATQGVAVVGVAQPGFGRSEGPWDLAGPATRAAFDALLAWTRQQSWVNADLVALGGYSSGATNALLLAARDQHVVAAVGAAGIYDVAQWFSTTDHELSVEAKRILSTATPEEITARSPLAFADQIRCPVRLIHGATDPVVPAAQAEIMARALEAVDNEPDLEIFPNRSHSSLPSAPFVDFLLEWLAEG